MYPNLTSTSFSPVPVSQPFNGLGPGTEISKDLEKYLNTSIQQKQEKLSTTTLDSPALVNVGTIGTNSPQPDTVTYKGMLVDRNTYNLFRQQENPFIAWLNSHPEYAAALDAPMNLIIKEASALPLFGDLFARSRQPYDALS